MAKHFLDNIDLNHSQILNAVIQVEPTDPSTAELAEGQLFYNSGSGLLKYYDGSSIHALGTTTGVDATTLDGQAGSYYLDLSNHTGTLLASSISNFDAEVSNNSDVAANTSARHDAVTLGTASGLSLAGQELSLSLATGSNSGAMSSADKTAIDNLATTYAALSHDHTLSEITDAGTAAGYDVGTSDGQLPALGVGGKLSSSVLPAIAISSTSVVSSQVAMLALAAQEGDIAVRTDENKSYILTTNDPTDIGNWQELLTPTDAVASVNGQTGVVSLTTTNISEGVNLYWTNSRFDTRIGTTSLSSLAAAAANVSMGGNRLMNVATPTVASDAATMGYVDDEISSHTHTASDVTDFDTQVRTSRLDQMAAPTSAVSMNSQSITNLGTPSSDSDAATKVYVDDAVANAGTAFAAFVPAGSTSPTINHNLGTSDIKWSVYRVADGVEVDVGGARANGSGTPSDNDLTLTFTTAPTSNQFRVVVVGA